MVSIFLCPVVERTTCKKVHVEKRTGTRAGYKETIAILGMMEDLCLSANQKRRTRLLVLQANRRVVLACKTSNTQVEWVAVHRLNALG